MLVAWIEGKTTANRVFLIVNTQMHQGTWVDVLPPFLKCH